MLFGLTCCQWVDYPSSNKIGRRWETWVLEVSNGQVCTEGNRTVGQIKGVLKMLLGLAYRVSMGQTQREMVACRNALLMKL